MHQEGLILLWGISRPGWFVVCSPIELYPPPHASPWLKRARVVQWGRGPPFWCLPLSPPVSSSWPPAMVVPWPLAMASPAAMASRHGLPGNRLPGPVSGHDRQRSAGPATGTPPSRRSSSMRSRSRACRAPRIAAGPRALRIPSALAVTHHTWGSLQARASVVLHIEGCTGSRWWAGIH